MSISKYKSQNKVIKILPRIVLPRIKLPHEFVGQPTISENKMVTLRYSDVHPCFITIKDYKLQGNDDKQNTGFDHSQYEKTGSTTARGSKPQSRNHPYPGCYDIPKRRDTPRDYPFINYNKIQLMCKLDQFVTILDQCNPTSVTLTKHSKEGKFWNHMWKAKNSINKLKMALMMLDEGTVFQRTSPNHIPRLQDLREDSLPLITPLIKVNDEDIPVIHIPEPSPCPWRPW